MKDSSDLNRTENWQTRAINWLLLVSAGVSALALPTAISRYQEGAAGVTPIIGSTSMIAVWGLNKWSRILEKREYLAQMRSHLSSDKSTLENEVSELEAQFDAKPSNGPAPKL
jgi:hypothetical protein